MNNILRYLRQNRLKIIVIVFFIIFIYSIVHSADDAYKQQARQNNTETEQITETINNSNKNYASTIKDFLEKCTKGNYEEAYTYLSENCKKEKYPTLEEFVSNYCEKNAIKGKGYSIKRNNSTSYSVELNNLLSSGNKDKKTTIKNYTIIIEDDGNVRIDIE